MGKSLTELLAETEEALDKPITDRKPIGAFDTGDEKILWTFLYEENRARTYRHKYRRWKSLVKPVPKRPARKLIQDTNSEAPELLRRLYLNAPAWEGVITPDTVDAFGGHFITVYQRVAEMTANKFEGIVAYAKGIAAQRDEKPKKVVKDLAVRNEIYRRLLPKAELYGFLSGLINQLVATRLATMFALNAELDSKQERLGRAYDVGLRIIRIYTNIRASLPSEDIIKSYITDMREYTTLRAKKIYAQ